jgi:hypothetical protein
LFWRCFGNESTHGGRLELGQAGQGRSAADCDAEFGDLPRR